MITISSNRSNNKTTQEITGKLDSINKVWHDNLVMEKKMGRPFVMPAIHNVVLDKQEISFRNYGRRIAKNVTVKSNFIRLISKNEFRYLNSNAPDSLDIAPDETKMIYIPISEMYEWIGLGVTYYLKLDINYNDWLEDDIYKEQHYFVFIIDEKTGYVSNNIVTDPNIKRDIDLLVSSIRR